MKAIKITQKLKEENSKHSFIKNANIGDIVGATIPHEFYHNNAVIWGYKDRVDLQDIDGWKDVLIPEHNTVTQKVESTIIEVGGNYVFKVVNKTDEEIKNEQIQISESNKYQKIAEASQAVIINELMNETDIETILGNMDIYPIWEAGLDVKNGADYPNGIPDRFKHFNADNELTLYEVIQSHATQSDWKPKDTPAMFKVVSPDGVIPVFVQPTGAHDAYQIGDQVHFPTENDPIYESLINSNTYSPTAYPAGWKTV